MTCSPHQTYNTVQYSYLINNTRQPSSLLGMLQCEVLSVEKASMASGLEAKDAQMDRMQQEHSNVQTQLLLCQEHVSQLQSELLQVCPHCLCSSVPPRKEKTRCDGPFHSPSIPHFITFPILLQATGDLCTLSCPGWCHCTVSNICHAVVVLF